MQEIEIKKELLAVKVAFGLSIEIFYYDSSLEEFEQKLSWDFIYFPRHKRNIPTSMIKDHWIVEWMEKTREIKMSSLTSEQKSKVKEYIKNMQKNIGREPTDIELDKMIHKAVHWFTEEEKQEKLDEKGRKKTIEFIRKMRERKEKTWKYF